VPFASTAAPAIEWNPPSSFSIAAPDASMVELMRRSPAGGAESTSSTAKFRSRTCLRCVTSSSALSYANFPARRNVPQPFSSQTV
jgi:hypothetical protein